MELIVNCKPWKKRVLEATGAVQDVSFDFTPTQSSRVALRTYASSHTNPVWVEGDGKPVPASRKSA